LEEIARSNKRNGELLNVASIAAAPHGCLPGASVSFASGQQPGEADGSVNLLVACVRLPQVTSDIVISLSSPPDEVAMSTQDFQQIVMSFKVHNMGLFGQ